MRGWIANLLFVGIVAAGCSSGASGASGADGGSCAMVDVCGAISVAQMNMACGTATVTATPQSTTMDMETVSACTYKKDANAELAKAWRDCYANDWQAAALYDAGHKDMTAGTTVTDVSGVGDKAYFKDVMVAGGSGNLTLYVLKGHTLYYFECASLAPAQDANAKTALVALATPFVAAH